MEGTADGKVMRHATIDQPMVVLPSEEASGASPADPTVSEYRKAYEDAKLATATANAAADTANASAAKANQFAQNILVGTAKDTVATVDDAFKGAGIRRLVVEGASEQVTTTGKNLLDISKFEGGINSTNIVVGNDSIKFDYDGLYCFVQYKLDNRADYAGKVIYTSFDSQTNGKSPCIQLSFIDGSQKGQHYGNGSTIPSDIAEQSGTLYMRIYANNTGQQASGSFTMAKPMLSFDNKAPYEPYTGGKSSPSADYPQEIKVIENPVVKVHGKNLLKYPFQVSHKDTEVINGVTFTDNKDGSITIKGTATSTTYYNLDFKTPIKMLRGKTLTCDIWTNSATFFLSVEANDANYNSYNCLICNSSTKRSGTVPATAEYFRVYICIIAGQTVDNIFYPIVELGATPSGYEHYFEQSQAFALPAEHPYLAKTGSFADYIEVAEDGTVELVANTAIDTNVTSVTSFSKSGKYFSLVSNIPAFPSQHVNYSAPVLCDVFGKKHIVKENGIGRTWNGIYVYNTTFSTQEEAQAYVDSVAPLTVLASAPQKRYPLTPITMPTAPGNVVNVWTDGEVQGDTEIECVRDVNIVVSHLESAIASITEG